VLKHFPATNSIRDEIPIARRQASIILGVNSAPNKMEGPGNCKDPSIFTLFAVEFIF
jgi:hypothetical protein